LQTGVTFFVAFVGTEVTTSECFATVLVADQYIRIFVAFNFYFVPTRSFLVDLQMNER
jgi:hypothetical protein